MVRRYRQGTACYLNLTYFLTINVGVIGPILSYLSMTTNSQSFERVNVPLTGRMQEQPSVTWDTLWLFCDYSIDGFTKVRPIIPNAKLRLTTHRAIVGLLYAILAALLLLVAYFRARHNRHDFADGEGSITATKWVRIKGQSGRRIYGRPFITAGLIVVAVSAVVLMVEIGLFVLVVKL